MSVMTAIAVDRFAPIDLDELVEHAGLLTRVDRKYVLPLAELAPVLDAVPDRTRVLEIDSQRVFGYRSTYLDTPDLVAYHRAGQGRRRRFKVRTRSYLDTGTCWLEVKTRGSRGTTIKERIAHHDVADSPLTAAGRDFIDTALDEGKILDVRAADLEPVIVTSYRRSTLLLPDGLCRATIDVDLGWTRVGDGRDFDRPGHAIVETKAGSTPAVLDRLLWAHGHRPTTISKFAVGLAALDPTLRRLKWARILKEIA